MTALMVHVFVQIWDMRRVLSEVREAYIEIVEIKGKVILVVYFSTGEYITFQLSNNIKNIVFRPNGEDQNCLYLSLETNELLFIERLSSRDANNLKMFLDRVHQNHLQPPVRPDRDGSIFASTTTQKARGKTASQKIRKMSSSQSFEEERNETPDDKKMPLFESKSSTSTCKELLENRYGKGKRRPSSGSKMNKDSLKKNTSARGKLSKKSPLRYVSHNEKEKLRFKWLKQKNKLELGPSFKIDSAGNPYLDVTDLLQRASEKIYLAFLSESKYGEDDPEWGKLKMTFDFYLEKLLQGLPNLGNTCYMNAVLQSLLSIPSFTNDLLSQGFSCGKIPHDALSICLAQLLVLKDIYNIEIKVKLLVNIKEAISKAAEIFSGNRQNDAYEFLGHCLEQVKQNMEQLNTSWKTKIESEEGHLPQQVSAGSGDTNVLVCPVTSNFFFELLHSTICRGCENVVCKTEVSNSLSISIPQGAQAIPLSIQSSFDLFLEAEEIEYNCEMCKHGRSVVVHSFSRLPRVLIIHLKRYKFNESWSFKKDDQEVIISKHLKLSSYCSEITESPLPLSKNAPLRDFQVLEIFKMNSEAISSLTASTKQTSQSKDYLAPHIRSEKESEPQKPRTLHKASSFKQQQKDLEKYSKLNIIESTLANSGHGAAIARELLAVGLMMNLEDSSISLKGTPTSSRDTYRKVGENRKLKKYKRTKKSTDSESVAETTKKFCKGEKRRISEESCKVPEETQQCGRISLCEQDLCLTLLQSIPKPDTQCYTEKCRPTELNFQGAKVNSLGALGSNKDPGNKGSSDVEETESSAKKPKREAKMGDSHDYRLIGVISHLGKRPTTGHYVNDAYNFERQEWFTYNDLQVSSVQEAQMQEARLCTGYIFFYMHNEIFEEMLGRE